MSQTLTQSKNLDVQGFRFLDRLYFKTAVTVFQAKRSLQNLKTLRTQPQFGQLEDHPFLLAESRSPLFGNSLEERAFEEGKIENLKMACRGLQKLIVGSNSEFSFWERVGRPTESQGFQVGREIRWGCLVPSVGGGLCQLSGALYDCALQIGAEIIESHPHTRRLPHSAYRPEMDSTVFWNYVDFRFRPWKTIFLEAFIGDEEFILRFWGKEPGTSSGPRPVSSPKPVAQDCLDCGVTGCYSHKETEEYLNVSAGTVVNEKKFRALLFKVVDRLISSFLYRLPLPIGRIAVIRGKALAVCFKTLHPFGVRNLPVSQDLAPYLQEWLGSKKAVYNMNLEHLPLGLLQEKLDHLAKIHPDDVRLREYRVHASLIEKEQACIQGAASIWMEHPYLKELFPSGQNTLRCGIPKASMAGERSPKGILFPGPCLAREGYLEVLPIAEALGLKVFCTHRGAGGKSGVVYVDQNQVPWKDILAYVHPCVFDQPNRVLDRAVAFGIPIVGTLGVPYRGELFCEVGLGDKVDLEMKLSRIILEKGGGK